MTTREIKFRAWDKIKKSMMYRFAISPDAKVVGWNGFKEAWTRVENEDDYILMQYTGLKDKNGKEIYEGDIVEENNESGVRNYKVEWEKYDCAFEFVPLFEGHTINLNLGSIYTEVTVIGNICENPELLKN